ncbi:cytochrome C [Sulfurimonas sp. CS5]|uniref:cytochrome C n=1 Tax=Sulfurimonas sp. CS5 TaxID=3391145 RepID=UPI0039EB897B
MKKLISLLLTLLVASTVFSTVVSADDKKGQKYYNKKLKVCKKNGVQSAASFAARNDRESWADAKEDGKLQNAWKEICPSGAKKFDKMKPKQVQDLYDFVWQYASDGDVPSCN